MTRPAAPVEPCMMAHDRVEWCKLAMGLGAAVAISCATAAHSQPEQKGAGAVAEVTVRANSGPALWRVTKGRSELVILGSLTPTPQNARWDTRRFAEALQGARVLLLSPASTPGLAWAEKFSESQRYLLGQPFGRTLAKELGPEAGMRFGGMAAMIRVPASEYGSYRPAPAGMRLLEDSWRARGMSGSKLDDAAVAMARAMHVRVVKVDEGGALPLIDAMPTMSKAQQAACVGEEMDQFEWEGANMSAAFQAWARGDLSDLRLVYKPPSLCLTSIPGGVKRMESARSAWIKALSDALDTPGRTVAISDVADLLEPSDLLTALRARGATVTSPGGEHMTSDQSMRLASIINVVTAKPIDLVDAVPEDFIRGFCRLFAPPPLRRRLGERLDERSTWRTAMSRVSQRCR